MEELKKCPFCGEEVELMGFDVYWIECPECRIETNMYKTKEEAIEAWNRRVE